jgi:hypothetical protein
MFLTKSNLILSDFIFSLKLNQSIFLFCNTYFGIFHFLNYFQKKKLNFQMPKSGGHFFFFCQNLLDPTSLVCDDRVACFRYLTRIRLTMASFQMKNFKKKVHIIFEMQQYLKIKKKKIV